MADPHSASRWRLAPVAALGLLLQGCSDTTKYRKHIIHELTREETEFNVVQGQDSHDDDHQLIEVDLDNDGDDDILHVSDHIVTWWENDGVGRFFKHEVLDRWAAVSVGDLDGDGDMDILAGNFTGGHIEWFENDGGGKLFRREIINTARRNLATKIVDIDGDGDNDILMAGSFLGWYENDGKQEFKEHRLTSINYWAESVNYADMDDDGDLDILTTYGGVVAWFENLGGLTFEEHYVSNPAPSSGFRRIFPQDVDSDGDLDLVGVSRNGERALWFENNGSQVFETFHEFATNCMSGATVDVDGNGATDMVTGYYNVFHSNRSGVNWYENDGKGSFTPHLVEYRHVHDVVPADMDGDGAIDFAASLSMDGKLMPALAWYENPCWVERGLSGEDLKLEERSALGCDMMNKETCEAIVLAGLVEGGHMKVSNDLCKGDCVAFASLRANFGQLYGANMMDVVFCALGVLYMSVVARLRRLKIMRIRMENGPYLVALFIGSLFNFGNVLLQVIALMQIAVVKPTVNAIQNSNCLSTRGGAVQMRDAMANFDRSLHAIGLLGGLELCVGLVGCALHARILQLLRLADEIEHPPPPPASEDAEGGKDKQDAEKAADTQREAVEEERILATVDVRHIQKFLRQAKMVFGMAFAVAVINLVLAILDYNSLTLPALHESNRVANGIKLASKPDKGNWCLLVGNWEALNSTMHCPENL